MENFGMIGTAVTRNNDRTGIEKVKTAKSQVTQKEVEKKITLCICEYIILLKSMAILSIQCAAINKQSGCYSSNSDFFAALGITVWIIHGPWFEKALKCYFGPFSCISLSLLLVLAEM